NIERGGGCIETGARVLVYTRSEGGTRPHLRRFLRRYIFMTIVIKLRDDSERSGNVLAARKKRGILLVKNLARIVWRPTKSISARRSLFEHFFDCVCVVANCFDDRLKNRPGEIRLYSQYTTVILGV
ncbi:Hypothetical predicted protein, partial [Paramuricea clavata]